MALLQTWLIPLSLVALAFYAIYNNRLRIWRATGGWERRPGKAKPGKGSLGRAVAGRTLPNVLAGGKAKEPRWVPIQSAIGSDRPLVPAAQLLRRHGVEARIVRSTRLRGRRLMRLVIRQTDVRRAREIMSKEDLYVKSRLES